MAKSGPRELLCHAPGYCPLIRLAIELSELHLCSKCLHALVNYAIFVLKSTKPWTTMAHHNIILAWLGGQGPLCATIFNEAVPSRRS